MAGRRINRPESFGWGMVVGKKYREELAKRRAVKHVRSLVLVDDAAIRRDSFRKAAKIIRKLDRLEGAIEHYHATETRLYSDWFDLTFRGIREKIEDKRLEYVRLAEFHNSIVAMASLHDIAMWEAFRLIKQEEEAYANGDERERAKIDRLRVERRKFAETEMRKEFGSDFGDEEDFEDSDRSEDIATEHSENESFEPDDDKRGEVESILGMPEKKIRNTFKDYDAGISLLVHAFELAEVTGQAKVFLRVGVCTPPSSIRFFTGFF